MLEQEFFDETLEMKPLEAEIRHLFNHHISMLCNQKWKIIDEITKWSTTLISQIQEYVIQQRKFLEQVYEKRVFCLNTIRNRILKQALIYEQKEDNEQVNQWLNQCNTLKLELATLNYINRPISTIQLVAEEQSIQPNTDEQNGQKTEDEQSPMELIDNNEKNIINNTDTNEYEPPQVTSTNTASINTPPLLTKSMKNEDQSIINNSKLKNNVSNDNELLGKCPICFMIFPQSMTAHNRNRHVNEHY